MVWNKKDKNFLFVEKRKIVEKVLRGTALLPQVVFISSIKLISSSVSFQVFNEIKPLCLNIIMVHSSLIQSLLKTKGFEAVFHCFPA